MINLITVVAPKKCTFVGREPWFTVFSSEFRSPLYTHTHTRMHTQSHGGHYCTLVYCYVTTNVTTNL